MLSAQASLILLLAWALNQALAVQLVPPSFCADMAAIEFNYRPRGKVRVQLKMTLDAVESVASL
jgi:hypothetical protein